MLKPATERCFQVIGASLEKIETLKWGFSLTASTELAALGKAVNEHYEKVPHDKIWEHFKQDLPLLKKEVESLLQQ